MLPRWRARTASSSVTVEEGHVLQWPSKFQDGKIVFEAEHLHISAVALHVGPHFFERLGQARFQGNRMQPVDEEQAADSRSRGCRAS